jgi:hypothetical protein
LARVTISAPVVTVTPVAPSDAAAVIETGTVRLVSIAALGAPAVTALLAKVTTEDVLKCVKFPVIVTGTLLAPCCPVFGLIWVTTGVPASTVKPLVNVSTWVPVVTVTFTNPTAALAAIFKTAVMWAASVTATEVTVINGPKLT